MASLSKNHRVFSLDLLGQGQSWPQEDISPEDGLCYSVDTWKEQIAHFIDNIVGEPTHIIGNSLGGYLSASIAYSYPEFIRSAVLLNPTPFWAFAPPLGQYSPLPWDGYLPAPEWIYKFGSFYFDIMRNPSTVKTMLNAVYADKNAIDDSLIDNIIDSASHPFGHKAFSSILFSPKSSISFDNMLKNMTCPTCFIYGKDDPWIVPYWGQRAKRLKQDAVYFELTPTDHCPHHESPQTVNTILLTWLQLLEQQQQQQKENNILNTGNNIDLHQYMNSVVGQYAEREGTNVTATIVDGSPRTLIERIGEWLHNE